MTTEENIPDKSIPTSQMEVVVKKKVTRRDVDKWEVAMLNFNIEPRSKPSDLFGKIEERRKIRHDEALKILAKDLHKINQMTEKNIMLSSLEVKSYMKLFNEQLQKILQSIDVPEVASYDNSVFLKYQNQAGNLKSQLQKMVDELHEDLNKFEDERAIKNEKLFHVAFEEIRKIGYLLPNDVQILIENEVVKMNQLSLNNRRCYDDLKLTLSLLTIQTIKQFTDKMFCIREKWVQLKLEEISKIQTPWKKRMGVQVRDNHFRFELRGRELPVEITSDNHYHIVGREIWQQNVYEVVNVIERNAKNIIEVYKKMLRASYSIFDSDFDEIKREVDMIDILEITDRTMKPLIIEEEINEFDETQNTEVYWQETLYEVKPLLEDVVDFLVSICSIWDKHVERLNESKIMVLKALEKTEEDFVDGIEEFEIKLNIGLDNLRQETEKVKLDKAYNEVVDLLNTIKANYESNYLMKISVVEDFYKMMNLEANVLSAGLREFLHQSRVIDSRILIFHEEQSENFSEKNFVFKAVNNCSQMVKTIGFWKEGVWRALKHLSKNSKKFLEPIADDWVERKVEGLAEQMSTKIDLLEKRFERVRVEFYEKRLREIETHRSLCNKHKEGIKQTFEKLKENLKDLTSKQLKELDELEKSFAIIEKKAKTENRAEVIHSSKLMLNQRNQELQEKFKYVYDSFRVDTEAKISEMKNSNVNFMKSIKLFHEGGTYSAEEGKMFATQLEAFDKEINNEYKSIVKETTKEETELLKKGSACFTQTLSQLTLLYDETAFYKQVRERICDVVVKINDYVSTLLDDFSSLEKLANYFFWSVKNTKAPLKDDDFWIPSFNMLYKNVCNLFYPLELPKIEFGAMKSGESEKITLPLMAQFTKVYLHTSHSNQVEPDTSFMFKDFKVDLFNSETPPPDNGSFMAIISNTLWKEMDSFQKLASNFYKKLEKRKIIREDLIPTSFEVLGKGILSLFQKYYYQCEELWLRTVLDFLLILGQMKLVTNRYLQRKLEEHRDLAFESLTIYKNDFMNCLRSLSSNSSNVFRELENKLLPLHGNPRNKNLLNELEEEVVQRTAVLETQWNATIELYQNQLKCFRLDRARKRYEIDKILSQYVKMRDQLFINPLGVDLMDLLKGYVQKGGFLTRRNSTEAKKSTEEKENDSGCEPMLGDFELKIESDNLFRVDDYLKKLNDLIENEYSYYSYVSQGHPTENQKDSPNQSELHLLLFPDDPEDSVSKTLQPVDECMKKLKSVAEANAKVHEEILFKWLSTWKFNVKKIQKLYTVMYPEKPEEPVQLTHKG